MYEKLLFTPKEILQKAQWKIWQIYFYLLKYFASKFVSYFSTMSLSLFDFVYNVLLLCVYKGDWDGVVENKTFIPYQNFINFHFMPFQSSFVYVDFECWF